MPCFGYSSFWNANPRLWEKCRNQVAAEMIASGWNKHARKFGEVQFKKATRLFLNSK